MRRSYIPVSESFAEWRNDPTYRRAYDALEQEFVHADAVVAPHLHAGATNVGLHVTSVPMKKA